MSVPRQGVEPCSLRTKRRTPARWGSLAQGRVLTSLSRAAATAVAEKRGAPHGGPRKPLKLQYTKKDVRPCVFRCQRLHGCCKSQPTGGLPTASDTDKHLRWWVSCGFRVPAAKRCITCPGNDFRATLHYVCNHPVLAAVSAPTR